MSLSLAPVAPLWLIAAGVLLLVLPALRTRFWPQESRGSGWRWRSCWRCCSR
ncbi:hypothetical protein [Hankyongella ginsenosidimutans]|uniref:hypothetical protein n=1 Tax=Hankyongella ginsenosidimutans TaxID=1763828 RepID=UPI001CA36CBA|nr:hypothetical protein [Hankyongella ginsenosidimutans]